MLKYTEDLANTKRVAYSPSILLYYISTANTMRSIHTYTKADDVELNQTHVERCALPVTVRWLICNASTKVARATVVDAHEFWNVLGKSQRTITAHQFSSHV